MSQKPIAIYYEHPAWFKALFAELDRRGVAYEKLTAREYTFDPAVRESKYSLWVNRVGAMPSAETQPGLILYVKQFLAYLDGIGSNVINGSFSFQVATSKAMQVDIFERLGLAYPRCKIIHEPCQALQAAAGLVFPIVIKPNAGGSGVGIRKFYSMTALEQAVTSESIDLGIDYTGLVQEYLPAKDNHIVRVEILNDEFLYAIRLPVMEDSFNYCPADGCHVSARPDLEIKSYHPPPEVIEAVRQILAASQTEVGGVEYLINDRDDRIYYYDINPLSNFVANAPIIVGFDPVKKFADFVLDRAGV